MRRPVEDLGRLPTLPAGAVLIDSHCHLDMRIFEADRAEVLARAAQVGVAAVVTIGASGSLDANEAAVRLTDAWPDVYATVGMHPHEAKHLDEHAVERLTALAAHPKVVAVGETGLDYHYDHSPRPVQEAAFRRHVALARALRLPLVVHLREAVPDAVRVLREERAYEVGGVIHCFSADRTAAAAFLDLGFHLSFSGILTFADADAVREAAAYAPRDRILVETDAPFLAPVPYRGRRNEPALVVATAHALAQARGEPVDVVAHATTDNARRLFSLDGYDLAA